MEFVFKNISSGRRLRLPVTVSEGLTMPDVDHISVRSPRQHGSTYVATYFRPREVSLQWALRGCDPDEFERKHRDLVQIINPLDSGEIQIYDANDQVYTLPCRLSASLALDRYDGGHAAEVLGQFTADDPYFKSPQLTINFTTAIQSPLVIPFVIPSVISGGAKAEFVVTNNGHVTSYPLIQINTNLTKPVRLTNVTTGEILTIDTNIVSVLTVDMKNKTAFSSFTFSVLGSTSGTFWGLIPGSNTIRIEHANAAVRSGTLKYDPLYLAVA